MPGGGLLVRAFRVSGYFALVGYGLLEDLDTRDRLPGYPVPAARRGIACIRNKKPGNQLPYKRSIGIGIPKPIQSIPNASPSL